MENDVMVRFNSQSLATQFLSEEEIKRRCPLAYVESPTNEKVSDKYVLANTATVISDMEKLGWKVVEAKQRKKHVDSSGRFSFHMVVFQNPQLKITKTTEEGEEIDCYPRLILTNSHDGLNCFKFMVGLFRLVCSNGLIIATDELVDLRIRHIYYNFDELRNVLDEAIQQVAFKVERMTLAAGKILTVEEKYELATKAIAIRKGCEEVHLSQETLDELLTPLRKEDEGNSLWNTFNILQEKVIKGGFSMENAKGKVQKVRKITSFVKDLDVNTQLWRAMEEFLVEEQ